MQHSNPHKPLPSRDRKPTSMAPPQQGDLTSHITPSKENPATPSSHARVVTSRSNNSPQKPNSAKSSSPITSHKISSQNTETKTDGRHGSQMPRSHAHDPSKHGKENRSAPVKQASGNQPFPDNDFRPSGMGPPGAGTPFEGKGKGKATDPIANKSFPPAWGFERVQKQPFGAPVQEMTLLELLSCRKNELFEPHRFNMEAPLTMANVTKSNDFPWTDVRRRCHAWPDFTFQGMLKEFPFLNRTVPVPGESGTL